jgi:hypothetical protein
MEVPSSKDNEGEYITTANKGEGRNQKWNIKYVDGKDKGDEPGKGDKNENFGFIVGRPFYIVSKSYMRRVFSAQSNKLVYTKARKEGDDAQKWFFDQKSKTIRNVKYTKIQDKDHSLDISKTNNLYLSPTDSRWYQMFKYEEKDGNLVDFKGQVLGIGGGDREDANIKREQKDSKKITQEWTIEYIVGGKGGKGDDDDSGKGGDGEGEGGKGGDGKGDKGGDDNGPSGGDDDKSIEDEFGMDLGRPFHIVTMQSSQRLLDVIGNQVVIKTENKLDSQTWYFDKVSRSIINKKNKQALDMRSNR